ncbi:hypothetical protein ATSB10_10330 [Dyella thiooxydans]|uniref:UspA domain-containing protein n=1 Tax=Dyella thiooxydans TaxID=445710 RepID=A0A160MZQ7_9GAMM|nr:universal stress protein [Dyella thiooxydans]AND68487.1 hypothetical protein ATSB10_10330 [Dyella thiooxydans]
MRDIVVHSPDFRHWPATVRYAAQLAADTRAGLTGLYIAAPTVALPGPPQLAQEALAYAQDELQQAVLAGPAFAAWATTLGVREARWQVAQGPAADALVLAGQWNDVVILQGNVPPCSVDERLVLETLLSGVGCILVPSAGFSPGRVARAVVAWDSSLASHRALHGALPLLVDATAVALLQPPPERRPGRPLFDPASHLRSRGVNVTRIETVGEADEDAGEHLLAIAAEERADLLVLGASGCRRPGGCSFGATTRVVLSRSHLPLYLRH